MVSSWRRIFEQSILDTTITKPNAKAEEYKKTNRKMLHLSLEKEIFISLYILCEVVIMKVFASCGAQ